MSADHIVTKWHWLRGWVPAHEPVATLPQVRLPRTDAQKWEDRSLGHPTDYIDPSLFYSELRASTANNDVNQIYVRTRR